MPSAQCLTHGDVLLFNEIQVRRWLSFIILSWLLPAGDFGTKEVIAFQQFAQL